MCFSDGMKTQLEIPDINSRLYSLLQSINYFSVESYKHLDVFPNAYILVLRLLTII